MKLIKVLGMVAIVTAAASALFGTHTAMANQSTSLCQVNNELPCAAANRWGAGTLFSALAENIRILNDISDVFCKHSYFESELRQALANPLESKVIALSFSECNLENLSKTPCTTETTKGEILILKLKANHGQLQLHNNTVKIVCGFFMSCVYGGLPILEVTMLNPEARHATATKSTLTRTGGICPSTSTLDALYKFYSPTPMYLSS